MFTQKYDKDDYPFSLDLLFNYIRDNGMILFDSNKNIAAVNNMLNRYPKVKRRSITKLIKETIQPKKKAIKFC